jgi:hypothetical protein
MLIFCAGCCSFGTYRRRINACHDKGELRAENIRSLREHASRGPTRPSVKSSSAKRPFEDPSEGTEVITMGIDTQSRGRRPAALIPPSSAGMSETSALLVADRAALGFPALRHDPEHRWRARHPVPRTSHRTRLRRVRVAEQLHLCTDHYNTDRTPNVAAQRLTAYR